MADRIQKGERNPMNLDEAKAIVNNEAMYCRSAGDGCLDMTDGDSDYGAWLLRKAEAQEMVLTEVARLTAIVSRCGICRQQLAGHTAVAQKQRGELEAANERLTRQRDIAWAAMAALKDVLPGWHPTKYTGTEDAETYLAFVARLDKIEAAEAKGQ